MNKQLNINGIAPKNVNGWLETVIKYGFPWKPENKMLKTVMELIAKQNK